jgi:phage shock protein C
MDTTPNETPATATTGAQEKLPTGHAAAPLGEQRLHRVGRGRMLAGVAAGLADYFDVDPTIVRIGFVALALLGGLAVPLYLAGWLLIPDEDADQSVAEELLARERARSAY